MVTPAASAQDADRPLKDPVKLARAARIIRAALARQGLTLDDLPARGPLCDCGQHGGA